MPQSKFLFKTGLNYLKFSSSTLISATHAFCIHTKATDPGKDFLSDNFSYKRRDLGLNYSG